MAEISTLSMQLSDVQTCEILEEHFSRTTVSQGNKPTGLVQKCFVFYSQSFWQSLVWFSMLSLTLWCVISSCMFFP